MCTCIWKYILSIQCAYVSINIIDYAYLFDEGRKLLIFITKNKIIFLCYKSGSNLEQLKREKKQNLYVDWVKQKSSNKNMNIKFEFE
jgi:hypothetical protein